MGQLKSIFLSSLVILCAVGVCGCASDAPKETVSSTYRDSLETTYDSTLATTLGADEYGMHKYVMAFLKAGPNRDQDSTKAAELQRAHLNNINRLAEEGKLVLAGPFLDTGPMRGIYIFNVSTIEEAKELTATDPAIQAGRLEMELHPWYGSAALQKVNEIHASISRQGI